MGALRITNMHGESIESLKRERTATTVKKGQVKISAVMMNIEGMSCRQIAKALHITPHTACKYVRDYEEGGLEKLLAYRCGPGRPSKLSEEEKQDCREKLLSTPEAAGVGVGVNWDSRLLQLYIQKTYGKTISRSNLQKVMKAMGFSYTRPTYVLAKADSSKLRMPKIRLRNCQQTLNEPARYCLKTRVTSASIRPSKPHGF